MLAFLWPTFFERIFPYNGESEWILTTLTIASRLEYLDYRRESTFKNTTTESLISVKFG
jgi:hypothetical protein